MSGRQAPEIYSRPLEEHEDPQKAISTLSLAYAAKGWNAVVTIDEGMVRVLAVPQEGIEPKVYLLGLLKNGFLEDALPGLKAMYEMLDDPDICFNYGLALSELGQPAESLAPLQKCLALDADYTDAAIALGVAHAKLGDNETAAAVLKSALETKPGHPLILQNLAGTLAKASKFEEAIPVFREAVAAAPGSPVVLMGLAQCLELVGGDAAKKEAHALFRELATNFAGTPFGEKAKAILNKRGTDDLRKVVDGGFRPDAVEYMIAAHKRFSEMPKDKVGQAVLEIARLGEQGLAIGNPTKRYQLESLTGDFSGLQLLCYMHVGFAMFDPNTDCGSGLSKEYEIAKGMF